MLHLLLEHGFGFVHLYQANEIMDALMNGWWEIFDVEDTALGGYIAASARLPVVGGLIVLTLYQVRLQRVAASNNLFHNNSLNAKR